MGGRTGDFRRFLGRILRVDLSNGRLIPEDIDAGVFMTCLGGLGLNAKILFEEIGPQIDGLSPENIVVISAGLLNGTGAPTAHRGEITTKSPLTGIFGTGNYGGLFASNLRKAGYEAVVLKGKLKDPGYLIISNDHVELRAAGHLWGKDAWETTDAIKGELGKDFSVMAIGQAGENLVKFACPIVDYHHAPGRSHAGCIMGSKSIKAIAVRGTRKIEIGDEQLFKAVTKEIVARIKGYPERSLRQEVGSTYLIAAAARRGRLGAKNYQTGILPETNEIWRPESYKKHLVKGPTYCGNCPLSVFYGCNITADVKEGKDKGLFMQGVSFSHPVWNWGGKCAIESFTSMLKCRELCNRYGMDQMASVPFALELYQRGILTKENFDGKELRWGDEEAINGLLYKIAYRQGIGDALAEGSARAAKIIGRGADKYALTIKGMEILSGVDPRTLGMPTLLGYMTCARGGDDLKNTHSIVENIPDWVRKQGMKDEEYASWFLNSLDMPAAIKEGIYGKPLHVPPLKPTLESIALTTKWYEDMGPVRDSLGVCLFAVNTVGAIGPTLCARLLSAYLGTDFSPPELLIIGERITNLMRLYNEREGLSRRDDRLPERFFAESLKDGPSEGAILSKGKMEQLLDSYYDLRGWDRQTGNPTANKMKELGLSEFK